MSEMSAAFQKWFDGYGDVEEPSAYDGFKAGWEAAVRAGAESWKMIQIEGSPEAGSNLDWPPLNVREHKASCAMLQVVGPTSEDSCSCGAAFNGRG